MIDDRLAEISKRCDTAMNTLDVDELTYYKEKQCREDIPYLLKVIAGNASIVAELAAEIKGVRATNQDLNAKVDQYITALDLACRCIGETEEYCKSIFVKETEPKHWIDEAANELAPSCKICELKPNEHRENGKCIWRKVGEGVYELNVQKRNGDSNETE